MTIQGYPLCLALRRAVRKGAWKPISYLIFRANRCNKGGVVTNITLGRFITPEGAP